VKNRRHERAFFGRPGVLRNGLIGREGLLFAVLAVALLGLGAYLARSIYDVKHPTRDGQVEIARQVARARGGVEMTLPIPARPGSIFARSKRSHVLLAGSREVPSSFIDPKLLDDAQLSEVLTKLAKIFGLDRAELAEKIARRRTSRFVWVSRLITPEKAQALRDLKCRALGIQYEWVREYPNERLAGTVIGFRRKNGDPGGGLELSADKIISARQGKRVLRADARRRAIWAQAELALSPADGGDIYTSIDVNIQGYLQKAVAEAVEQFDAKWGVGLVVNPWTGDILAMCSVPTFDPNQYNTTRPGDMLNRAIASPYEPGSVFKPIIAAAAVQAGLTNYQTKIDCENGVYHARRGGRISDHGHSYGMLSLWDVIVHSSNIGMAKVGEKMGNTKLWQTLGQWGFGQPTGLGLPGETGGVVRPLKRWDGYSLRRVPFGQEIAASAVQLTMAFAAIANGGLLMKPRLVQSITDSRGEVLWASRPGAVRRVLSPAVSRATLAAMQDVVQRGTGKNCRLKNWSSWGKTGTAQIPGPQGYIDGAYTGSFIGGAPTARPAVVCLISIYWPDRHKGYYGSVVAAPFVKQVLQKTLTYLDVPPERPGEALDADGR